VFMVRVSPFTHLDFLAQVLFDICTVLIGALLRYGGDVESKSENRIT